MALDGRTVVDNMTGSRRIVMDVSTNTRERCQRALNDQTRRSNTARALATADREEIMSDRKVQRCKEGSFADSTDMVARQSSKENYAADSSLTSVTTSTPRQPN